MKWAKENLEQCIKYINLELINGRTMIDIEKVDFNVNERVIHKRLVRLGYKKINNQYVLSDDVKQMNNNSNTSKKEKCNNLPTNVKQSSENIIPNIFNLNEIENLKELLSLLEPLKSVLQLYNKGITPENIIDVDPIEIKIDRNKFAGETTPAGFRVDKKILSEWKEFTKANEKDFKVQDLVGQALLEFMEKYK